MAEYITRSLMLVKALAPVIGYDEAPTIAHQAMSNDLMLQEATFISGISTKRRSIASSIQRR
jgi:fumarate hydratase, class II